LRGALGTIGSCSRHGRSQGGAKARSPADERFLVVTLVTPTAARRSADLSDPGLNNVITVRFSSYVNQRDIIESERREKPVVEVEFMDATFLRLPGTPACARTVQVLAALGTTPSCPRVSTR